MSLVEDSIYVVHYVGAADPKAPRFVRRWRVEGEATISRDLRTSTVTLKRYSGAVPDLLDAARAHEYGHLRVWQDVKDADSNSAFETLQGYDAFQAEVEAWARGFENDIGLLDISANVGYLILDALNSYRRSLGVSQADWNAAVELICAYAPHIAEDLRRYKPLEPEPGENPPSCVVEREDNGDGDGDEPKPDEPQDGLGDEPEKPAPTESEEYNGMGSWDAQEVIDFLLEGNSLREAADKFDLQTPPSVLAEAVAQG